MAFSTGRLIQVNPNSSLGPMLPASQAKRQVGMQNPDELRELASWYREFAERAGNPTIWEARLLMAEDLEAEAARIERDLSARRQPTRILREGR